MKVLLLAWSITLAQVIRGLAIGCALWRLVVGPRAQRWPLIGRLANSSAFVLTGRERGVVRIADTEGRTSRTGGGSCCRSSRSHRRA